MSPREIKRYIADGKCYEHNNSIIVAIVPAAVTNFSVVQEYHNPNDTNATVVDVTIYWNKVRFIKMELYIYFFLATNFISSFCTRICYLSKHYW